MSIQDEALDWLTDARMAKLMGAAELLRPDIITMGDLLQACLMTDQEMVWGFMSFKDVRDNSRGFYVRLGRPPADPAKYVVRVMDYEMERGRDLDGLLLERLRQGIYTLLREHSLRYLQCMKLSKCQGCGQVITWNKTTKGKAAPMNLLGVSHFADCPRANEFRKGKG